MMLSRRFFLRGLLVAGATAGAPPALAQEAIDKTRRLVVVVGADSPITDLSMAALRGLFLGEAVEAAGGGRMLPLNDPPGMPTRVAFDRTALRMTPEEAGRYWVDRRIRGQGQPPRAVTPGSLRLRLLARFPLAVTYVLATDLDPAVKPIRIDGRPWTVPGYALVIG